MKLLVVVPFGCRARLAAAICVTSCMASCAGDGLHPCDIVGYEAEEPDVTVVSFPTTQALRKCSSFDGPCVGDNGYLVFFDEQFEERGTPVDTDLHGVDFAAAPIVGDMGLIVAVGDSGTIVHSADFGASWSTPDSGTDADLRDVKLGPSISGATFAVAIGNGVILRDANLTASWEAVDIDGTPDLRLLSRWDETTLVAAGGAGELLESTDQGASWQALASPTLADITALAGFDGGLTVFDTDRRAWRRDPESDSWESFDLELRARVVGVRTSELTVIILEDWSAMYSTDLDEWTHLELPDPGSEPRDVAGSRYDDAHGTICQSIRVVAANGNVVRIHSQVRAKWAGTCLGND